MEMVARRSHDLLVLHVAWGRYKFSVQVSLFRPIPSTKIDTYRSGHFKTMRETSKRAEVLVDAATERCISGGIEIRRRV